jgi:hypothetical protein
MTHFVRDSLPDHPFVVVRQSSFLTIFPTKSLSIHDATEGFLSLAALPVRHMGIDVGSRTAIRMPNPVINDVELEHAHPADLSTISSNTLSNKCRYDSHQLSVTYCVAQENSHG